MVFDGLCRDRSNNRDWLMATTRNSASECRKECGGMNDCVAFSYKTKGEKNCNLYRNGPYTHGDGKNNTKCYIMNTE